MDNLDVVRGPRIDNARSMSGGRISVDSTGLCNGDGLYNPVIVYKGRVFLLSDNRGSAGRLHYRDITPEQSELDAIDALSILYGSRNEPVSSGKRRYA